MKVLVFAAASCLAGCPAVPDDPEMPEDPQETPRDEGGTPDDPADPYLLDINNFWQVRGEGNGHGFTFAAKPGTRLLSSSTLGGSEVPPTGSVFRQLDGFFENRRIHFTSTLDSDVITYDGVISEDRRMHLTVSPGGVHIVLFPT